MQHARHTWRNVARWFETFQRTEIEYFGGVYGSYPYGATLPPAGDYWFGLPAQLFDLNYWQSKTGIDFATIFPRYSGGQYTRSDGTSFQVPHIKFNWVESSNEALKAVTLKSNTRNMKAFVEFVQLYADFTQADPLGKVAQIAATSMPIDFLSIYGLTETTTRIDVSFNLAQAMRAFVDETGRLPAMMFSDYMGDLRFPAPVFESDSLGVKCPTYAALSLLAVNPNWVRFTDLGPRIVSDEIYKVFRASFWAVLGSRLDSYFTDYINDAGDVQDAAGYQIVKLIPDVETAYLSQYSMLGGRGYKPIPMIATLGNSIIASYNTRLREAETEAQKQYSKAANISAVGAIITFLTIGASIESFGALMSGDVTIANVVGTVKLGDTLGLVEADNFLTLASVWGSIDKLSQSVINSALNDTGSLDAFAFESIENDASVSVAIPEPVDVSPVLPDTVSTLPVVTNMDDIWSGYEGYDWGADIGIDMGSVSDVLPEDFGSVDWSWLSQDFGVDLVSEISAGVDYDFWNQIGIDPASVSTNIPASTFDLYEMIGDTSLGQFGAITGATLDTVQNAAAAASTGILDNLTAAGSALLKLWTQYKLAEKQVKTTSPGAVPPTMAISTRPTQPGQILRQPDGSISIMEQNGVIRTIRPDGSTVTTQPNQTFPDIFNKNNLLIAGAAIGGAALVYLLSRK